MSDLPDRIANLSPRQRALLALKEMKARLRSMEESAREAIAVVGIGCRFPGGATSPEAYWDLLRRGVDAVTEIPPGRWDVDAFYDPDPEAPGKAYVRRGGFLDAVDRFDAAFFGIAPREAAAMDPQQRILLEVAWEALENAGEAADRLSGSATGVYVGLCHNDYEGIHPRAGDPSRIDAYTGTGNAASVVAGRVAYTFGFHGPCLTLDTACSSSLVAVHLACQSLRGRECDRALAAGVNLILAPESYVYFSKLRALAPDSRAKTFDAGADGYVRGEGCAVVVLKRLSDALEAGDDVLALVRGSAVGQDGRTSGLTAPSGPAQEDVIRRALVSAGVAPAEVDYVEAHGTGTALGDPIEVRALAAALGPGRPEDRALAVGSAKTNVGHLEAAAGLAGLVKVVLALREESIPPHLHLRSLNPHVPWAETSIAIPTAPTPWPRSPRRRIAGVSSFGFSGTNAHVVLEEAPPRGPVAAGTAGRSAELLVLSARTGPALRELETRMKAALAGASDPFPDVCRAALAGRSRFAHRAAVVARSAEEARRALEAHLAGEPAPELVTGRAEGPVAPEVAFLFTGQGSIPAGTGRRLHGTEPAFRGEIARCDEVLGSRLGRSIASMLALDGPGEDPALVQPFLFALEVALAALWRSWGARPAAVMGHSLGEYAAAVAAGAVPLEDALGLVAERGRLMRRLEPGVMAAVFAEVGVVEAALARAGGAVSIAAFNGPTETVVSGATPAVEALLAALESRGIASRRLATTHAFHSPLVEPILDEFERAAAHVRFAPPRVGWVSNLTGTMLGEGDRVDAAYWRRHVREPVRFHQGLEVLRRAGIRILVEVGPGSTLLGIARRTIPEGEGVLLPSLDREGDEHVRMLRTLAELHVRGVEVDPAGLYPGRGRRVRLPNYPFERKRYWYEGTRPVPRAGTPTGHPLLERRIETPLEVSIWETEFDASRHGFLADHQVYGVAVVPAVVHLEMALAAVGAGSVLEDVTLASALTVPAGEGRTAQLVVRDSTFEIHARAGGAWRLSSTGRIRREQPAPAAAVRLDEVRARCPRRMAALEFQRERLVAGASAGEGHRLGPTFANLEEVWLGEGESLGRVRVPPDALPWIRPALLALDSAFQLLAGTVLAEPGTFHLPIGLGRLAFHAEPAGALWAHARSRGPDSGDLVLADESLRVVAEVEGMRFARATREAVRGAPRAALGELLHEVRWIPASRLDQPLARPAPEYLPSPAEVESELGGSRDGVDPELGRGLARLAARYAAGTLAELGPEAATRIAPRHRAFFGRMVEIASESGDPEALRAELLARHPDLEVEIGLVARCGESLAAVLRGERDPLSILFPGEAGASASSVYGEGVAARAANELASRVVARLARDLPAGRVFKILEVGAGTGGTTARVLGRLPAGGTEYVFTDVSSHFTRGAAKRFREHGFLRYEILDLEKEPEDQGFAPGQFDVVLAANVLHATADLRRTLGRLARLLAPSGALVVLEATGKQAWLDLTFGLTEGWWAFEDREIRPDHPLLDGSRWLEVLASAGFSAASLEGTGYAVLVARRGPSEAPAPASPPRAGTDVVVRDGRVATALEAVRTLARGVGGRLWLVTRGVHRVVPGDPASGHAQSLLWGFGRVVANEHPELWGGLVDLPAEVDPAADEVEIRAELASPPAGELVAFRAGQRWSARLVRRGAAPAREVAIRPRGAYVVTGGLGGLGLEVARWLVEKGARHLVLVGRSAPSEAARQAIDRLAAAGARVEVRRADVAREPELARALEGARPLAGAIHAAGTLDDAALLSLDLGRFETVLGPKRDGAYNLHRLTANEPLDFFVLFGSAAALLGTPGQANHAAACSFLDALAHHRRALGLPATAIDWGPWAGVGRAAGRRTVAGMGSIEPETGIAALEAALAEDATQVAVLPVDWSAFAANFPPGADPPFLRSVARGRDERPAAVPEGEFRRRLEAAPPGDRRALLVEHVRSAVESVLGADPSSPVGLDDGFRELGMDSLMSVELRNHLQRSLGRPLPGTIAFEQPTVRKLAGWLAGEEPAPAPAGPDPEAARRVEAMSEEEVERLLLEKLDSLEEKR